jgi:hypothetical protein
MRDEPLDTKSGDKDIPIDRDSAEYFERMSATITGLSTKDLNDELALPTLHGKTAENIGCFIIAWGVLERELDVAFPVLFQTEATLAVCLYANLGTKAKLDIINSAVTMLSGPLGTRLTDTAHAILKRISDLNDKARNTIAHGQLKLFRDEVSGKHSWELVRHAARKSAAITIYPGNSRYWGTQESIALKLAQKWRTCVAKMHGKILGRKSLRRTCLAQIRESELSYARPRKRQPPKRSGLGGRQTKLSKWPRR